VFSGRLLRRCRDRDVEGAATRLGKQCEAYVVVWGRACNEISYSVLQTSGAPSAAHGSLAEMQPSIDSNDTSATHSTHSSIRLYRCISSVNIAANKQKNKAQHPPELGNDLNKRWSLRGVLMPAGRHKRRVGWQRGRKGCIVGCRPRKAVC
jgi:hypothetical protein